MSPYAASDLLAGKRFSLQGHGLLPGVDVQRRYLWKTFRGQAEQRSGVGQKVFGFSPEFVFGFAPGWCSESSRNGVRLQPGIVFGLPRNTHCLVKALKKRPRSFRKTEAGATVTASCPCLPMSGPPPTPLRSTAGLRHSFQSVYKPIPNGTCCSESAEWRVPLPTPLPPLGIAPSGNRSTPAWPVFVESEEPTLWLSARISCLRPTRLHPGIRCTPDCSTRVR